MTGATSPFRARFEPDMQHSLNDTVAIVTGASSGIGEATAAALAREGANVVLVARRRDRVEALSAQIASSGGKALPIEADVTKPSEAGKIVDAAMAAFGRIDTLVNNAGVMLLGPIETSPPAEWHRMLDLNVAALMEMTHAALPQLLASAAREPRRVADIVNISSVAGRVARVGSGVYNASKFAVGAFSESLRQEITQRHVRVSLVEPGAVHTELQSHNRPEILADMRKRFEGLEMLQASDIAETVAFIVTRPRHVAINELLVRPTGQEW